MRRFWLPLLLAAVALRLAALALPYTPVSDARWYHDAAVSLAHGGGLAVDGQPTAYRLPGYPFLLSLAYRAFGARVGLAWIWGTLATALLAASTFAIGKRLYGDRVARVSRPLGSRSTRRWCCRRGRQCPTSASPPARCG